MGRPAPASLILGFLSVLIPVALSRGFLPLFVALLLLAGLLTVFRPYRRDYLARVITALPIGLTAFLIMFLLNGFHNALLLFLRVMTTLLTIAVLTSSVSPMELVRGMWDIGFPRTFVETLYFTLRSVQSLRDDIERVANAARSKGWSGGPDPFDTKALPLLGNVYHSLIKNMFGRGLTAKEAMVVRGYSGTINTLGRRRFGPRELLFLAAMLAAGIVIAAGSFMDLL